MPIEIACGNCGNSFGVEAGWAGLIVQCPFCTATVQVPDEVAAFAEESVPTPPDNVAANNDPPAQVQSAPEPPTPQPSPRSADRFKRSEDKQRRPGSAESRQPPPEQQSRSGRKSRVPPAGPSQADRDLADANLADTQPAGLDEVAPAPKQSAPLPVTPSVPVESTNVEPAAPPPPPLPQWTRPPVCEWMQDSHASMAIQVVAREGLTTIQYHGRKLVLRDEPEAATWYGRISFAISVAALVVLLTWLYYVYR